MIPLRRILDTIARLDRLHTPEADACVNDLWQDVAEVALGGAWHGVGPAGDLAVADSLLRLEAA